MAAIDKTYIKTYNQYKEVYDWCRDIVVTFDDTFVKNVSFKPSDFISEYTEDDFKQLPENGELVLWNTPYYMDKWLIRNCPIGFIQKRLKEQYGNDYEDIKNGNCEMYERNGLGKDIHFKIIKKPNVYGRFSFIYTDRQNRLRVYKENRKGLWDISIEDEDNYWYYNEKHDYWTNVIEGFPFNSNACILKKKNLNIKSIYRYLRKWNLPAGIKITINNVRFNFGWELITK
nr:MAG TPA: hypothetical protein [Caudoviricetes sp.]